MLHALSPVIRCECEDLPYRDINEAYYDSDLEESYGSDSKPVKAGQTECLSVDDSEDEIGGVMEDDRKDNKEPEGGKKKVNELGDAASKNQAEPLKKEKAHTLNTGINVSVK